MSNTRGLRPHKYRGTARAAALFTFVSRTTALVALICAFFAGCTAGGQQQPATITALSPPTSVATAAPQAARPSATSPAADVQSGSPTAARAAATSRPGKTPTPRPNPTTSLDATATPERTLLPPEPSPTATPRDALPVALDEFIAAMRPAFASDIAAAVDLPRYTLRIRIDPDQRRLAGSVAILYPNRTGVQLEELALRLYPNFPRDVFGDGGDMRMDITGAAVDGLPVGAHYAAERTAVLLPLPRPLLPGESTTLHVEFSATIEPWDDGTWPLPSYYPMLAVYDGDGWRLDVTSFADKVYSESALYAAEITVPAQMTIIGAGTLIARHEQGDGTTTYVVRSGPIRNFAISMGEFSVGQEMAGDVAVRVYRARDSGLDGGQVARVAAAALADFEQRFGPYPFNELDIHLMPLSFDAGDEYPGMILLYVDGQIDARARYVTAHEVAHQWWYGIVGNDILREAWLDEAFAQYSAIIYAEDVEGEAVAAEHWEREVLARYHQAQADGDLPVGLAIDRYPSFNVYYRTVYGKGAVFLRLLRDELGDEHFFSALRRYYEQHRYGIATTTSFQQILEETSGRDLDELFRRWVTGE